MLITYNHIRFLILLIVVSVKASNLFFLDVILWGFGSVKDQGSNDLKTVGNPIEIEFCWETAALWLLFSIAINSIKHQVTVHQTWERSSITTTGRDPWSFLWFCLPTRCTIYAVIKCLTLTFLLVKTVAWLCLQILLGFHAYFSKMCIHFNKMCVLYFDRIMFKVFWWESFIFPRSFVPGDLW